MCEISIKIKQEDTFNVSKSIKKIKENRNSKKGENDLNENNNSMWKFKILQRNDGNSRKNGITRELYVGSYL